MPAQDELRAAGDSVRRQDSARVSKIPDTQSPVPLGIRTYFFPITYFSWDVRSAKCVMNVATKGENINIDWSPDGKTIAVGNKEDLGLYLRLYVCRDKF